MSEFVSRFVNVDGINTHYLEAGDAGAPPVVLIHGGGAGADAVGNWRYCIPKFAEEFHVLAVEMVGFGKTDKPDPISYEYSQEARNRHMAGFITAMDMGPLPLVGNSMGGATALGVAMEQPELVDRLVLMGSAGLNEEVTPALEPIVNYDFTPEGMRRLIDALTSASFEITDELVKFRHDMSVVPETRDAYRHIMAWIRQQGGLAYTEEQISAVKTPALVVNGKDDLVVPLKNGYRFLELLENSWGYFIPHCGHWAMIEHADDFVTATRSFLLKDLGE
uniref:Meta-cleavage compound hydrolase n=1 Tax=carbazole-degrading bacterium OC6S TaxID=512997 RepID=E5RY15_UNCXX|nr:meta-cleavage compound hydrolase [carbazole-degrading bacterium OC6S]